MILRKVANRVTETFSLLSWTVVGYSLGEKIFPGDGIIHILFGVCGCTVGAFFTIQLFQLLRARRSSTD